MYSGSVTVPVYTPTCFEGPSSLSHFEDMCYPSGSPYGNNNYFVMSNAQDTGTIGTKRYLKPEERMVLCDIGYNTNSVFGDTAMHNYYNYNTTACLGINVAGINDMFTGFVGTTIAIGGILNNDFNASSFECLEDIYYTNPTYTTISATTGVDTTVVHFNSSIPGIHLLRYIPISSTGQRGNITYIYINVYSFDTNCLPTCTNLIKNGNFEELSPSYNPINPFILNQVCGWYSVWFTPEINFDSITGNHTSLIRADTSSFENPYASGTLYRESIGQFINISPGSYQLNFDYKLDCKKDTIHVTPNLLRRFDIYLEDANYSRYYIDTLNEMDTTTSFITHTTNFTVNNSYQRIIFEPL